MTNTEGADDDLTAADHQDQQQKDAAPDRSPLDRALDLGLFAPLGFLLEFRNVVPELAEAGRRQIAFSQSLGRAAIQGLTRGAAPVRRPKTVESVEVPGYDDMTAREVIALIGESDRQSLGWIQERETNNKHRVTVLRAAARRIGSS